MLNVVRTPFKSGTDYYPAGTIIQDPAGVALYTNRLLNRFIVLVDEHNLQETADYLVHRCGVTDAHETLKVALSDMRTKEKAADDYAQKAYKAAEQYGISTDGKSLDDIVAEVKAIAAKKPKLTK